MTNYFLIILILFGASQPLGASRPLRAGRIDESVGGGRSIAGLSTSGPKRPFIYPLDPFWPFTSQVTWLIII